VRSKAVQCMIGNTLDMWFEFVKCLFGQHIIVISHRTYNVFSLKCLVAILERYISFVTLRLLIRHYEEGNIFKLALHMYVLLLTNMLV